MKRDYFKQPLCDHDIERLRDTKDKYDNSKKYVSENEMVLIHKTNYAPVNNVVKSSYSAGATSIESGVLYGKEFKYSYLQADDYIHFSLNCEVSGDVFDIYGFNYRKYAVIIPGSEEEFKKISRFSANDIEFKGVKDISNCYLLCPFSEVQSIKVNNPNVILIPYVGDFVDNYAEAFANQLGFTIENTEEKSCMWVNSDPNRVSLVLDEYGYVFEEYGFDKYVEYCLLQQFLQYKSFTTNVLNIAIEEGFNIFDLFDDIDEIIKDNKISVRYLNKVQSGINHNILKFEKEEEKNFWENFLNDEFSPHKILFISILCKNISFDKISEDYQSYIKNKKQK